MVWWFLVYFWCMVGMEYCFLSILGFKIGGRFLKMWFWGVCCFGLFLDVECCGDFEDWFWGFLFVVCVDFG